MAWLPQQKILFGGCAIRSLSSKSAGNLVHGDIQSWLKITQHIKNQYKDVNIVVPGHGNVGGYELIQHTADLIQSHLKGL